MTEGGGGGVVHAFFDVEWPDVGTSRSSSHAHPSSLKVCAGNEDGHWLIREHFLLPPPTEQRDRQAGGDAARGRGSGAAGEEAGDISWITGGAKSGGLPIVAPYCRRNSSGGDRSGGAWWRFLVYGQWLVWGLPKASGDQALCGAQFYHTSLNFSCTLPQEPLNSSRPPLQQQACGMWRPVLSHLF